MPSFSFDRKPMLDVAGFVAAGEPTQRSETTE